MFFLPLAGAVIYDYVPAIKKYPLILLAHLLVWAVTAWGLKKAWYVDENFRKELLMARAIEEEDWEQIPAIFLSGTAEPTRLMVMNKNLALFRLGRAGDEMFQYREGRRTPQRAVPRTVGPRRRQSLVLPLRTGKTIATVGAWKTV